MTVISDAPERRAWMALGKALPRPEAIMVVSAHWETQGASHVTVGEQPRTIHDFRGFPDELYAIQYPAAGSPELVERVAELLGEDRIKRDATWGFDHGSWGVVQPMFPTADIPMVQLSLDRTASPEEHLARAAALAPLRDEGVLILASGAVTHNFGWLTWGENSKPVEAAQAFAAWLGDALARDDRPALLDYRHQSAHGAAAHPSEEHLLPLFSALGAANPGEIPLRLEPEYTYGGLAMDAYLWQDASPAPFNLEQ